jgi:hypothetical protein
LENLMLTHILAGFTTPQHIPNNTWSFLYILPLAFVLAVVYKATKITVFSWWMLLRESFILATSIVVFMAAIAASLYTFCTLVLR